MSDIRDMNGMNEDLRQAAEKGQLDEVKRLVAAGADKNTKNEVSDSLC